jgi:VIT1/CCC1 family predicted Fe2+/Mn2+ transporter
MALGEQVSVSSQHDSEDATIDFEKPELAESPMVEQFELAAIHRAVSARIGGSSPRIAVQRIKERRGSHSLMP